MRNKEKSPRKKNCLHISHVCVRIPAKHKEEEDEEGRPNWIPR
jgi:hypothetical protein